MIKTISWAAGIVMLMAGWVSDRSSAEEYTIGRPANGVWPGLVFCGGAKRKYGRP